MPRPASLLVALLMLLSAGLGSAPATWAAGCSFAQGFATLHDLIPDVVGDCIADAAPQPNGDVQQQTTKGA